MSTPGVQVDPLGKPNELNNQPQVDFEARKVNANADDVRRPEKELNFVGTKCATSIDLEWEDLTVTANIKQNVIENGKKKKVQSEKVILDGISGTLKHGKFTALMGPSGCGKTTLLNVLSGRSDSKLKMKGELRINNKPATDIEFIGNLVAFVQQDDILLPTITPREVFMFTAKLRLKLSAKERKERVENLIKDLGLTKCADTRVGNQLIRGLSGGERKRASIGVELITNPSLIFLDEPTTGLDSTTALNVLELLKALADNGRNVVSTIHQPSSEIFSQFDNLMLMVRGNIIYQGQASKAVQYFGTIGFPCPRLTNPADFFMKLMNESGLVLDEMSRSNDNKIIDINQEELEEKFKKRVVELVGGYNKSSMQADAHKNILSAQIENRKKFQVSWIKQFYLIFIRSIINEVRNPLDVKSKFYQIIFFSLIAIALYSKLDFDYDSIQNRIGVLFLGTTLSGMASITGSLGTFSLERPVFIRERMSKSYTSSAYFWGRAFAEIPILVCFPLVFAIITYWAIGLNDSGADKFFLFLALHILGWFAGSGYGLFLSTVFPSMEVALSLVPILVIPFLVFAGFFVSQDHIPIWLVEFEYLSIFKWLFQGVAYNEFKGLTFDCPQGQAGANMATCQNPLDNLLSFDEPFYVSFLALAGIGALFRVLAYIGLVTISTPKTAKLVRGTAKNTEKKSPYETPKAAITENEMQNFKNEAISPDMTIPKEREKPQL